MFRRSLSVLTAASLALACFTGCKKSVPPRIETMPMPSASDYNASEIGKFITLVKALPLAGRKPVVDRFLQDHSVWPLIENDTLASFIWFGKARTVAINGDLQFGWSRPDTMESIACGDDTLFSRTYPIPPDARLDYLFIIDGKETRDLRNPRITPSGFGPHSEVAMPRFVSNPVMIPRTGIPHGTIDSLMFITKGDILTSRPLEVYMPAGYDHLSALPSLYVYDGFEAMEYMSYPTVLDNLIHDGKIEPVIVIFIPFVDADMPFLFERHREFSDALCDELVRFIDQKYRTVNNPERRGIAGISAGGQFALMSEFDRPDVFLCAAGQSPTLKEDHFNALRSMFDSGKDHPAFRIYSDVGRYDLVGGSIEGLTFLQANRKFHDELQKCGLPHVYHESTGGHQWADWREKTEEILVYFFGRKR